MRRLDVARVRAFTAAALFLASLALVPATARAAKPQGLIHELSRPTDVAQIAPGDGKLWFTTFAGKKRPASVGWMKTGSAKVHAFRLAKGVMPNHLVVSGSAAWFTFSNGGLKRLGTIGGGIGRVTAGGKVTLFPEPPNPAGAPFEIVKGADGDLWFNHLGAFAAGGGAIGRITPSGEITEFTSGLGPTAQVEGLVLGEDGNIWFGDNSGNPAIGRITTAGEITEFPGLAPRPFGLLRGPAPAGGDSLWFSSEFNKPLAVERISSTGTITAFTAGLSPRAKFFSSFLGTPSGDAWFTVGRGAEGRTAGPGSGTPAIGHITAAGKITEYTRCLRPGLSLYGVGDLTRGPDGDVWFLAGAGAGISTAPSAIGRVDAAGEITEFRYGLPPGSEPDDLTVAGGRIWFVDSSLERIGWIVPPRLPANTAKVVRLRHGHSARAALEVAVPGPGRLGLREVGTRAGLGTSTAAAPSCGAATIAVPMAPRLIATLRRDGVVHLRGLLTFTPRHGTPYTTGVKIEVGGEKG
jgi:streptogramin lyase